MNDVRRLLITGALGHIGSRLIRVLPESFPQAEIVMVDNLATQRYASLFDLPSSGRYRFLNADILATDLRLLVEQADAVIHLAAITDAAASLSNRDEVERVNLGATRELAAACAKVGRPLVHLSSTSVYGTQKDVVSEDCGQEDLQPQSPYAETKLREEQLLAEAGRREGLDFATLRFGTICGVSPGMRFHTAVNKFCWQAATNIPLTVWRTALHQKRPYLDLEDAVRALTFVVQQSLFDGRIYNVATANLSVNDILTSIRGHLPEIQVELVDGEIMNQLSYEVTRSRFQEAGFEYQGSVARAIADTLSMLRPLSTLHSDR